MNTLARVIRRDLPALPRVQLLKRGERLLEPDVYVTCLDDQPAVVKDYSRYRWTPLSLVARWLVRREASVLRRLAGWRHAPALLGTLGGLVLGIELVPGQPLGSAGMEVGEEIFRQLRAAVAHLHAVGILHNDLHGANVMVGAGSLVLIDYTSAIRVPRWMRRLPIVRQLRRSDLANTLKMQSRAAGQAMPMRWHATLSEPAWVSGARAGWKRFYRRFKR
ncbi:kinase [Pseudoxanthomonas dokdonensis]|uniref:Kinase n=1 Tax=Pseudoxanthomonas dokdonensis TaxID=344882 RepID=A0A0R0CPW8_9GAMM|nr:kinase [Pseudoxanthomonas dokdonensis]KRG71919.1 kinase [Pseudoxanthomonas dokdonensis]